MSLTTFDTQPATTLTLFSASGKRMHPRVDYPMAVEFDNGDRRQTKDWSVAGFGLSEGFPSKEGAIHHVRLHLGLSDCDLVVDADAKVAWTSGGGARGFRFIDMTPDKTRILDHFIRSRLDGDSAIVGGLPVAHDALGPRPAPLGRHARWGHGIAQVGKLLMIGGAVVGGTVYVLTRFLTVTTDYAAVSADLQQIHAPSAGFLRSDMLAVGTHVTAGQSIGLVQPVPTPQTRLSTETEIAVLQTTLDQQHAALEQAKAGFATFLDASRTDLREATAARAMLDTQNAAEERIYQRLVTLSGSGTVPEQRLDQEQQVRLGLQRSLASARDLEAASRQKLVNAEAGRFSSDGRSTQKSPADIEQDISGTEATIARLKAMLAALDQPLSIVSPCDCTVMSLAATPNAYVTTGAPLADLARDTVGSTTIDALVQNPRLSLVRQGQDVTVYLPDHPDGIPGRVASINFNPSNTGRTGLPASLQTIDDYGLMRVDVGSTDGKLMTGLPVTVMAPIQWRAFVANLPAVAWVTASTDHAAHQAWALKEAAVSFFHQLGTTLVSRSVQTEKAA